MSVWKWAGKAFWVEEAIRTKARGFGWSRCGGGQELGASS